MSSEHNKWLFHFQNVAPEFQPIPNSVSNVAQYLFLSGVEESTQGVDAVVADKVSYLVLLTHGYGCVFASLFI